MAGVIGVFNDPVGLLHTPLDVEVLHGWHLRPGVVLSILCRALRFRAVQLPYQVVMQPIRILSMVHL